MIDLTTDTFTLSGETWCFTHEQAGDLQIVRLWLDPEDTFKDADKKATITYKVAGYGEPDDVRLKGAVFLNVLDGHQELKDAAFEIADRLFDANRWKQAA